MSKVVLGHEIMEGQAYRDGKLVWDWRAPEGTRVRVVKRLPDNFFLCRFYSDDGEVRQKTLPGREILFL